MIKKLNELTTLCGVDACAIIDNPYERQREAWPSELGARQVIAKFRNMPEIEQSKKMVTHNSFLEERIRKAMEQLKKQREDNRTEELTALMYLGLRGYNLEETVNNSIFFDLLSVMDQKVKELDHKIECLKQLQLIDQQHIGLTTFPAQVAITTTSVVEIAPGGTQNGEVVATPYTPYTAYQSVDAVPGPSTNMQRMTDTNNMAVGDVIAASLMENNDVSLLPFVLDLWFV